MVGATSDMTWYEKEVCKKWDECLIASGQEDHLRAFLGAGMDDSMEPSLTQASTQALVEASTQDSCIDPTIDDPESWDCECAQAMADKCEADGKGGTGLQACLRLAMCKAEEICCSWKKDRCPAPWKNCASLTEVGENATSLVKQDMMPARSDAGQNTSKEKLASLDESVSGKRDC